MRRSPHHANLEVNGGVASVGKSKKRTGKIWTKTRVVRAQIVNRVCQLLKREYGTPRLGNPKDPLDDLVYIVLSNKTSPEVAERIYRRLKSRFKSWDRLLASSPGSLKAILKPAGLSRVKSKQIRGALRRIAKDFGSCNLSPLKQLDPPDVHPYLVSLPGVSDKVAKCVMMYTLGAEVLPVDSHVHRIATRLGWAARKRADQCHEELEAVVPPQWRFTFHVGSVLHGREICRPECPACEKCCISRYCEYYKHRR
jgi:endonuclease III